MLQRVFTIALGLCIIAVGLAILVPLAIIFRKVIAAMLALILTAFLYVLAGCPKHDAPKRTEAETRARNASADQIDAWLRQERDDAGHADEASSSKAAPSSAEERLLDGQRRTRRRHAR